MGKEWVHPNRDLNVFHDMPLFGDVLYNLDADVEVSWKHFFVYHSLDLSNMNVKLKTKDHNIHVDVMTGIADGQLNAVIDGYIAENGIYTLQGAAAGEHIYVGEILKEIDVYNTISGLPVNIDLYIQEEICLKL